MVKIKRGGTTRFEIQGLERIETLVALKQCYMRLGGGDVGNLNEVVRNQSG